MNSGTEYSLEEACKIINSKLQDKTYKVNFTGGDPLIQHKAVREMAKHVKSKNIPTYLESSCFDSAKFSEVLPFIDFVKIEFKTKDSDFVDPKHFSTLMENAFECLKTSVSLKKITYIKIVVSSKTDLLSFKELIKRIFNIVSKTDIAGFIIQPTYGVSEPSLEQLLKLYDIVHTFYNEVRIIPQLHKLIGAP